MGINTPSGNDDLDMTIYLRTRDPEILQQIQQMERLLGDIRVGDMIKVNPGLAGLQNQTCTLLSYKITCMDPERYFSGTATPPSITLTPIAGERSAPTIILTAIEFTKSVTNGKLIRTRTNFEGREGYSRF